MGLVLAAIYWAFSDRWLLRRLDRQIERRLERSLRKQPVEEVLRLGPNQGGG